MRHWAADLIGCEYRRGAEGPEAYDCWGLVRQVVRVRYGIEMPPVAVADAGADNAAAIAQAARASGWSPAHDEAPRDGDVAIMRNLLGERHIGTVIEADGSLGLLHAIEGAGVCFQPLPAVRLAFRGLEFWRRQ